MHEHRDYGYFEIRVRRPTRCLWLTKWAVRLVLWLMDGEMRPRIDGHYGKWVRW